jgi:hypothetical protein
MVSAFAPVVWWPAVGRPATEEPRRLRKDPAGSKPRAGRHSGDRQANFRAGKTLKTIDSGEGSDRERHERMARVSRAHGRKGRTWRRMNPTRDAPTERVTPERKRKRPADQSLEVDAARPWTPVSGERADANGTGAATGDESARLRVASLNGKTPDVAAGWNKPASRSRSKPSRGRENLRTERNDGLAAS